MDPVQNLQNQTQSVSNSTSPSNNGVAFPSVNQPKKGGNGAKTILIIGILALTGILGFVIYKSATNKDEEIITEPTPFENVVDQTQQINEATPTPMATSSAVSKSEIKIQVQNGTGITGEAAYLETQLKKLGFENISVGNSSTQDQTSTKISLGASVPTSIATEIANKLGTIYQSVSTTTSTNTTYDIVIVTGLRKGSSTSKPTSSPASIIPSASPSASPKATP